MELDSHKFIGMSRDTHPINQKPELLWEAHNIRITNRDDSTLLAITNEKGNLNTGVTFNGQYLGHCVLGKYLVVFTVDDSNISYIYRVNNREDGSMRKVLLVKTNNLLNKDFPVQTLGIEETSLINKVYWVDGNSQPRKINITLPELRHAPSNTDDYSNYYEKNDIDFIPELALKEQIDITSVHGDGIFAPGVIQYAFTYFNKYSSESNIFYTTPLQYIAHQDRGGSPDSSIAMSFQININNTDDFDYIRVYSIHRTSLSAQPTVKIVKDIKVSDSVTIIDDGTTGSTIDPTLLLYIGGRSIIAGCIEQKDLTLFLGNITTLNNNIPNVQVEIPREDAGGNQIIETMNLKTALKGGSLIESFRNVTQIQNKVEGFYSYVNQLSYNTSTFKSGDWYRLGVQVQWKDGNWSDPIFVKDFTISNHSDQKDFYLQLPTIRKEIRTSVVKKLIEEGYKKVRGVVVFPDYSDRKVFAQGMLCPTVFNAKSRMNNSPYAQSSWFLRPFNNTNTFPDSNGNPELGAAAEYEHLGSLGSNSRGGIRSAELGGDKSFEWVNNEFIRDPEVDGLDNNFYVDQNILTFHSPDIEFNQSLVLPEDINYKLKIVGLINFTASKGDIDIQTSSPTIGIDSQGFSKPQIGVENKSIDSIRSLISGPFYKDEVVILTEADSKYVGADKEVEHFVFLWDGESLNNDVKRTSEGGTRTAVLQYKKISNLKYSAYNTWLNTSQQRIYDIPKVQLFNSDVLSLSKIEGSLRSKYKQLNYYGNVDTMVFPNLGNYIKYEEGDTSKIESIKNLQDKIEEGGLSWIANATNYDRSARVKYKSTPHIVLSLGNTASGASKILPSIAGINKFNFTDRPYWFEETIEDNNIEQYYDHKVAYVIHTNIRCTPQNLHEKITGNPSIAVGDYIIEYYHNGNRYEGYLYKAVNTANNDSSYEEITIDGQMVLQNKIYGYYDSNNPSYIYQYKAKYLGDGYYMSLDSTKFFGQSNSSYYQDDISNVNPEYPYLFLAELVRTEDTIKNPFGGKDAIALNQNLWCPAGDPIDLVDENKSLYIEYKYGDTWYQRYDCLKTYPFTKEDENQLVEIGSFMCETRINIDGRYDRNRGQDSNIEMSPQNFNLMNDVYSQKDNFFIHRILPEDFYSQNIYDKQIIWSKEKSPGEDVDTWTNITLANVLNLNGSSGKVTSINAFNENLIAFQEQGISLINFNSRVQVPTSDGVPIEIQNSYKVDGYTTYSNTVGCQDKWSICKSLDGIYFIDNHSNSLYKISGQAPEEVSSKLGMRQWFIDNKPGYLWNPEYKDVTKLNGIRTFYDKNNNDIYLVPGSDYYEERDSLVYSLKLQQFTSLMSYGGTPAMFNLDSKFYSLKKDGEGILTLWENFAGEYNNFYGVYKPFDITFISNANATYNKIFDTLEYRADIYDSSNNLLHDKSFTTIQVSNEYQDTEEHRFINKDLRKKFRVWRAIIPRDNRKGKRTRISNPWTKIKLKYDTEDNNKMVLHDMIVKYTV